VNIFIDFAVAFAALCFLLLMDLVVLPSAIFRNLNRFGNVRCAMTLPRKSFTDR
jgi:hypothetical protein